MNSFIGNGFAAFGYAGQGEALVHSGPITCWRAKNADGREGLLWRIRIERAEVEADRQRDPARWGRPGNEPDTPELRDALWRDIAGAVDRQMKKAACLAATVPGVMLVPRRSELQDYLLNASVKLLYILTDTAQPLRQALAAGVTDEAEALKLCAGVCARLQQARADGLVYGAFADCLINGWDMPIDVYDAAAWMAITPLTEASIRMGGAVVDIPDFTDERWLERDERTCGEYKLEK